MKWSWKIHDFWHDLQDLRAAREGAGNQPHYGLAAGSGSPARMAGIKPREQKSVFYRPFPGLISNAFSPATSMASLSRAAIIASAVQLILPDSTISSSSVR
jgi:hypothetical protein